MFGSALSYIALRILGEGPEDGEDGAMARGRKWILDHGGLVAIPSWGKFWVTVYMTIWNHYLMLVISSRHLKFISTDSHPINEN
jgi:hypothetical protein